jgi:hypothetical protein
MFHDPNEVLRQAIAGQASAGQEIVSFVTFDLTAEQPPSPKDPNAAPPPKGAKPQPAKTLIGGGTSNIGFLQGTDDAKDILAANSGNSHAFKMTVRYWIETVAATLTIKPKSSDPSDPQEFRMISPAGVLGPTFFVPASATAKLNAPREKKVTWTQIQYSQNVTLNFGQRGWPHISVATLGDTSRIPIKLPL